MCLGRSKAMGRNREIFSAKCRPGSSPRQRPVRIRWGGPASSAPLLPGTAGHEPERPGALSKHGRRAGVRPPGAALPPGNRGPGVPRGHVTGRCSRRPAEWGPPGELPRGPGLARARARCSRSPSWALPVRSRGRGSGGSRGSGAPLPRPRGPGRPGGGVGGPAPLPRPGSPRPDVGRGAAAARAAEGRPGRRTGQGARADFLPEGRGRPGSSCLLGRLLSGRGRGAGGSFGLSGCAGLTSSAGTSRLGTSAGVPRPWAVTRRPGTRAPLLNREGGDRLRVLSWGDRSAFGQFANQLVSGCFFNHFVFTFRALYQNFLITKE